MRLRTFSEDNKRAFFSNRLQQICYHLICYDAERSHLALQAKQYAKLYRELELDRDLTWGALESFRDAMTTGSPAEQRAEEELLSQRFVDKTFY